MQKPQQRKEINAFLALLVCHLVIDMHAKLRGTPLIKMHPVQSTGDTNTTIYP